MLDDDVYHATPAPLWRATLQASRPFQDSPLTDEQLAGHSARLEALIGEPNPIEDVYRLSPLQEAMYFHAVASDAEDLYVIQQRLEIAGPLDLVAFQDAWSRVVAHHPALRSVFVWDGSGVPAQIVCRGIDVEVEFTDLTGSTDAHQRTSTIEASIEADRRTRFQLDAPPVMRLLLFKVGAELHELVWSQHHLTEDGWSATFVLQQVFSAYEQLISGETPDLPTSRPYGDYIRWLEERDDEATKAFWRDHFSGFSTPTRMSIAPIGDESSTYVRISHSLGRDLSDRLRTFARERRLTLNTMLVGGMTLLLGRYVGKADVALGVVAS
ncbi:MAG: hypothetical protein KJO18_03565, partial [Acidimicrobiia bacterium]|nr:hypothetical protein [Acidimicrobiia bacterium]